MLCTNAAFFGNHNEKNAKSNPWGLHEEKWSLWTCCTCFKKRHVVPIDFVKTNSAKLPVKIVSEEEEAIQTKLESPQNTPIIRRSSPQQVFTQQLPPPSSGSESSGYFTPPAEHHLKDQVLERFTSDEHFEENNNFELPEPNFQVVDSETSETHEPDIMRQSSASSTELSGRIEDVDNKEAEQVEAQDEEKRYSPLDEVDFNENSRIFADPRSKSRSEGNLKTTLPEITERKNINSAPPLNDIVNIVPYNFTDSAEISPVKMSLPGSVASSENTPTKKQSGHTPKRLIRRSISVRTPSVKRASKSPKAVEARPISRPKEILNQGLSQMDSGDWETVIQGLNTLIRLARNHPEVLELNMHPICVALAKNIRNLRSQVARTACHASSEIFSSCKRGLEMELEELAAPLLQRTADTNKFLRSDANAALDAMSLNLSVPKVVAVVANKGSTHQNGVVRAAATRLLSDIAMRIGPEKVFQLPKETRDKFLFVGANGLTEGSLETRRYAKALMSTLAGQQQFQRALAEAVPQHTMRHIAKVINSLK
ncbi:hypothetical protein MTP99_012263 [Tenebrio molitor]|nr:hypothetical protein MTP99_012263 [Tenebrio molitor]